VHQIAGFQLEIQIPEEFAIAADATQALDAKRTICEGSRHCRAQCELAPDSTTTA
jgi:hypothetical protein